MTMSPAAISRFASVVNLNKSVQLSVRGLDPFERSIDDLDRREPAGGDLGRHDMSGQQSRIEVGRRHGLFSRRRSPPYDARHLLLSIESGGVVKLINVDRWRTL
jgi:hypothetical protein